MPSVFTDAGRALFAAKQAALEVLTIDEVRFGDPDVGGSDPEDPDAATTVQTDIVHTADLTALGYVNPDQVVFSVLLDTGVGDFDITQIGFWHIDGMVETLVFLVNVPTYHKRAVAEDTVGNFFGQNFLLKYSAAAEVTGAEFPAELWQLMMDQRINTGESRLRTGLRSILGRFAAFGGGLQISARAPVQKDACDATAGWVASSGAQSVDAADKQEGTGSLKLTGQALNATWTKTLGGAEDWSLYNGLLMELYSTVGATNVTWFVEDSTGNRSLWDITAQAAWAEVEIDLLNPTGDNGTPADLTDVLKFGLVGLDNGVTYHLDNIRLARFNDFAVAAGKATLEGLEWNALGATYAGHHDTWDTPGDPDALAPPGAGTRTDTVFLDVWLDGDFNTKRVFAQLLVDDAPVDDYEDANGNPHYVEALATILRTTKLRITTAMLTDVRRVVPVTDAGAIKDLIDEAVAALVNGAPGALDTLKELADALADDAAFATTVTNALALKAPLASPALTGHPTGVTEAAGDNSTRLATTAYLDGKLGANNGIATLDGGGKLSQNVDAGKVTSGTLADARMGITGKNLVTSGYIVLPGGLIEQWGEVSVGTTTINVNLPTTFPNAHLQSYVTTEVGGGSLNVNCNPVSTSQIRIENLSTTHVIRFFCIGY